MPRKLEKDKKQKNGEGSVYKRKRDGKYIGELTLSRDPITKKRTVVRTKPCETETEARNELTLLKADRVKGELKAPVRDSVAAFLYQWLDTVKAHQVKERTLTDYRYQLERYIEPNIGRIPLSKLTVMDVQGLYSRLSRQGLSANTVRLVKALLQQAIDQAVEWDMLPKNPAAKAKAPRVERKEFTPLTVEQVRRFLAVAAKDRYYAVFVLAIATGMRRGELLGLRWQDVDLKKGTLKVVQVLNLLHGRKIVFNTPKTKSSRRTIEIKQYAISALSSWKMQQNAWKADARESFEHPELVFTTELGTPVAPRNLRRTLDRLLAAAGCPKVRIHDLRHTAATLLLQDGERPDVVQKMLGHGDIKVTLGTYAHVMPEDATKAAERMDALLRPEKKAK